MDNGNGTEDFYIFYKATRVFIEWGDTESPTSSSNGIRRICSVTPQHFLLLLGNSKLYEASFDQCQLKLRMTCVRESVHDVQYCTDDRSAYLVLDNGSVLTQKLDDGCHSLTDLWQTVTFDPLELAEEGVCIKRVCCSADGTIFISDSCEIYALGNCGSHFSVDCFQPKLLRLFKDPMDVVDVSAGDNFFVFLTRKRKESKQVPPAAREYGELPDLVVCPETQHQRNETELSSSVHSSISHQNFELNVQHLLQFGYSLVHTEIYTMGSLNKGLLGTGDHIKRDSVVKIDKLQHIGVCSIATGRSHTVVRTIDGSFYHWGLNYEMSSPTELTFTSLDINTARSNILEACCGDYRTALLNTRGVIYDGDKEVMRQEKDFVTLQMKDGTQHSYPLLLASSDLTVYNRRLFKRQFCYLHHHLQNLAKTMLRYRKCCEQLKKIVELQQICLQWENVLYLTLTILNSLEQFYRGNYDDPSQLLIVAYFRECVYIFETYSKCYCDTYSIDGFSAAQQFCRAVNSSPATSTTESHNCENDNIGKIFKCPFQIFPHVTQLFEQLQKSSGCYKNELSSWHEFIRHNRIDMELAENTRDFWLSNQKNIKIAHFKRRERRVILSSTVVPIKTHSMMGLTTPVYILFSDCLCQLINHVSIFPLDAMWVKKDNSGIIIKTPEKKFTLVARNEIDCDLWYDQLESSIKSILNISEKSKIPEVRSIQYKFSNHSNSYSGVNVRGSFSNAVMHGKCHLQFPNGKIYAGEVRHGVIEGYGRMYIPKIGLYKGNFKNGKFFGRGTLIMNSKEIYEGNFRNGLFHGHGHLQLFDSIYVGEFEDNVKCGYGVLDILSSGEKYLGMFADNKRMGRGICITASGNYFEANFINDTLTGKSVAVFLNKYYYEGECTLNGPSGTGKYYMPVSESNQQDGDSIVSKSIVL